MPPFLRKKKKKQEMDTPMMATVGDGKPQSHHHVNRNNNKAAHLRHTMADLKASLTSTLYQREISSRKCIDLKQSLTEHNPDALEQTTSVETLQLADILIVLDEFFLMNKELQVSAQEMEDDRELQKETGNAQLMTLQSKSFLLEHQLKADRTKFRDELKVSNDEMKRLHKHFFKLRKSYHSCTKHLAEAAMKIVSVQNENKGLRQEADDNHQASIKVEAHVQALLEELREHAPRPSFEDDPASSTSSVLQHILQIQLDSLTNDEDGFSEYPKLKADSVSQLNSLRFENEKVLAEQTADRSIIKELRKRLLALETTQVATASARFDDVDQESTTSTDMNILGESRASGYSSSFTKRKVLSVSDLDKATGKLKVIIEALEEEKHQLSSNCKQKDDEITKLCKELEMKNDKLEMLQGMVRSFSTSPREDTASSWSLFSTPGTISTESFPSPVERSQPNTHIFRSMMEPIHGSKTDEENPTVGTVATDSQSAFETKALLNTKARRMHICIDGNMGNYTGPLGANGAPSGLGTIRFSDGSTYLGGMKEGKMHGKGTFYHGNNKDGVYRGEFENNRRKGTIDLSSRGGHKEHASTRVELKDLDG